MERSQAAALRRARPAVEARTAVPGGWGGGAIAIVLAGVLGGILLYVMVRRLDTATRAAEAPSPLARGQATYPALPAIRAAMAPAPPSGARPPARTTAPLPPQTADAAAWDRALALLDLPLRQIAAEVSVLELSYRPFAAACLATWKSPAGAATARDGDWLAGLKTARLLSGVTLRDKGGTVDCEAARLLLVKRADVLKSDLDANEKLGRTSGVRPEHWRRLTALYALDVFDRY